MLIATMPDDRLMLLLDVIEDIETNRASRSEAARLLPDVFKQSLAETEPETPSNVAMIVEAEYTPQSSLGLRLLVYLASYADHPGSVKIRGDTVFFLAGRIEWKLRNSWPRLLM